MDKYSHMTIKVRHTFSAALQSWILKPSGLPERCDKIMFYTLKKKEPDTLTSWQVKNGKLAILCQAALNLVQNASDVQDGNRNLCHKFTDYILLRGQWTAAATQR